MRCSERNEIRFSYFFVYIPQLGPMPYFTTPHPVPPRPTSLPRSTPTTDRYCYVVPLNLAPFPPSLPSTSCLSTRTRLTTPSIPVLIAYVLLSRYLSPAILTLVPRPLLQFTCKHNALAPSSCSFPTVLFGGLLLAYALDLSSDVYIVFGK